MAPNKRQVDVQDQILFQVEFMAGGIAREWSKGEDRTARQGGRQVGTEDAIYH